MSTRHAVLKKGIEFLLPKSVCSLPHSRQIANRVEYTDVLKTHYC
jgi:hypothetical protein